MKKITITGTKGKTTVSSVLSAVLMAANRGNVLRVDTTGAYLNDQLRVSKVQSQTTWDIVPTVAPGRFLYLLHEPGAAVGQEENHATVDGVAILEASLGCGTSSGLGYYGHDVGIFTNVFEDHLGSRSDLSTRADIGKSKNFVFSRINRDGYAVFNADDDVVCAELGKCKEGVTMLPFGSGFTYFDVEAHLASGGMAITLEDDYVILRTKNEKKKLVNVKNVVWTFDGKFIPSIYNLMAVIAGLIGLAEGNVDEQLLQILTESRLDPYAGRLTLLRNQNDVVVLADYAHEKQSLASVAMLAKQLKGSDTNKVIGVLRLAWDRTPELIEDTASHIAESYDNFIIYDKIDGFWREPSKRFRTGQRQFTQEIGKTSKLFTDALQSSVNAERVVRVLREDEALEYAARLAKPGDIVVFIVNDDIKRSIDFVKKIFDAELA